MQRSSLVGLCLVVSLAAMLAAQPQTPATPPPTFRSGVTIVTTDVIVLDKDRRPVRGLTAADFRITENGAPQRVVAVTEILVPPPPEAGAAWTREIGSDGAMSDRLATRMVRFIVE